jgi:hypothetical protein
LPHLVKSHEWLVVGNVPAAHQRSKGAGRDEMQGSVGLVLAACAKHFGD